MRAYLRAFGVLACAAASHAASVNLLNHGFESGLGGWVTTGNVQALGSTSVVTFNDITWNITPNGSQMAALNSNGVQANTLDSFFGIAGNTLQALNQQGLHANPNAGGALTNGSGIYQDFWGNAGDTVTMFYNYVARDYIPYNDPAFSVLVSPSGEVNAEIISSIYGGGVEVGTAGNSGWRSVNYTLEETGTYRLGFGLTNDRDTVLDSALFLDVAAGSSTTPDPGDLVPGSTPLFPILPDSSAGGSLVFNNPTPGFWYDPPFAESYTYTLFGGAEFTQFATPPSGFGYGDLLFTDLSGSNASFVAEPGKLYDISDTSSFKLSGVPNGLIDFQSPGFTTAFPAYLDWSGVATKLQIDITPYDIGNTPDVPEPSTYALIGAGLSGIVLLRKRKA